MSLILELAWKSIGLIALAAILNGLLKNRSASLRHRIWVLTFVALATLPFLTLRLPSLNFERPGAVVHRLNPNRTATVIPKQSSTPIYASSTIANGSTQSDPLPSEFIVIVIWALGTIGFAVRTLLQLLQVLSLSKAGRDLNFDASMGLPSHCRLANCPLVDVPVTFGYWRPTILLPDESDQWSDAQMRPVLLHESAHISRGDWAWMVFARFVAAVYWPNPLIYLALTRLRVESEMSADDAVLNAGVAGSDYASVLVDLAERAQQRPLQTALPFVEGDSLKARVSRVLRNASRNPMGRKAAGIAVLVSVLVVLPFASMRVVQGPDHTDDGIVSLGGAESCQIVAITDMQAKEPVSWDIHGSKLPTVRAVDEKPWAPFEAAKPSRKGDPVRYVILRSSSPDLASVKFTSGSAEPLQLLPYNDPQDPTTRFQDALDGSYYVLRLVAPYGERAINLTVSYGSGNFKLLGYRDFGPSQALYNPTLSLTASPWKTAKFDMTQVAFDLPKESENSETDVKVYPGGTEAKFVGLSGHLEAMPQIPANQLQRVEVLNRPLKQIQLSDIPMTIHSEVPTQAPTFLPDIDRTAKHGTVSLNTGVSLKISSIMNAISNVDAGWNADGEPTSKVRPLRIQGPDIEGQIIGIALQASGAVPISIKDDTVYDDSGLPFIRVLSTSTRFLDNQPPVQTIGLTGGIDKNLEHADLNAGIASGPYSVIKKIERDRYFGAIWSFGERKGWKGSLKIELPSNVVEEIAGYDILFVPLDASGSEITTGKEGVTSEYGADYVAFNLDKEQAQRVKSLEIKRRRWEWVRFTNVAMYPNR